MYFIYVAASVAPRAAMFVCFVVLTRVLPVAEYGLFALVVTLGEILDMTSTNWVRVHLLRTEAGATMMRPRRLGRALGLSCGATLLALAAAVLLVPFVNEARKGELVVATVAYVAAFAALR
ncbi:MAG: hypothetical protein ACYDAR_20930, partial [Thermomicrobiales bacterium]